MADFQKIAREVSFANAEPWPDGGKTFSKNVFFVSNVFVNKPGFEMTNVW